MKSVYNRLLLYAKLLIILKLKWQFPGSEKEIDLTDFLYIEGEFDKTDRTAVIEDADRRQHFTDNINFKASSEKIFF